MATITYLNEKGEKKRWWDVPVLALSGLLGVIAVEVSIDSFKAQEPISSVLASVILVALMLLPAYRVILHLRRQYLARKLAKAFDLCRDDSISFANLEKRASTKNTAETVKQLLRKGYLQYIAVDEERDCVRLVKPWNEVSPGQKAILDTGNSEFDEKLAEIRHLNDDIKNWKVSSKIDRIEQLTASIFQVIYEKPERADDARRFMNYYLPTTLKLLESYKLMEKQSYQGDNILTSRKRIEEVLDTMIHAMEGQQDKLFKYDVLDVESDITVLDTLMAADGLSGKGALPR